MELFTLQGGGAAPVEELDGFVGFVVECEGAEALLGGWMLVGCFAFDGRRNGKAYIDTRHASPDGDSDRLAHIGLRARLNPLHRLAAEQQRLHDGLPFPRRAGAVARAQLANAVVSHWCAS